MSTERSFVDYVFEQAALGDALTCKPMFGEYGVYLEGKIIAFICDNSLFIKAADGTQHLTRHLPMRPPYPGAKDYPVADELLDDTDTLRTLLIETEKALPAPKIKKPTPERSRARKPKS